MVKIIMLLVDCGRLMVLLSSKKKLVVSIIFGMVRINMLLIFSVWFVSIFCCVWSLWLFYSSIMVSIMYNIFVVSVICNEVYSVCYSIGCVSIFGNWWFSLLMIIVSNGGSNSSSVSIINIVL